MSRRKLAGIAAMGAVALLAVLAAGCGGGGGGGGEEATTAAGTGAPAQTLAGSTQLAEEGAQPGGTFRIGYENSFNFTNNFDPVGEYLGTAISIYSSLLLRTLVGYNHVAGPDGNVIVPDLATDTGQVSDDGLTYTFTLKDGVKFGPPVSREITSKDVLYAFQRIGTPDLVAQYGFYYTVIKGMQEFTDGKADTISGIETPDDKTIVFTLTQPTGDFLYRLAEPAAAPAPEEVAGCFKKAGDYGRYVVSSAGYMIEGADQADATSCDTLKPFPGYQPDSELKLVRNPDYDPATDSTEARQNFPDAFDFIINTNNDDIFNKITAGEYDAEVAGVTAKVLKQYASDDELKNRLEVNAGDRTWYITMNLTQPPFDDIHVRKAANLVMDKFGLQRAWGGPIKGDIATHIIPNTMLAEQLRDYDPYPTPDFSGDVDAAKAEMKQSKYDSDGDGICDGDACEVLLVNRTDQIWKDMEPVIVASLEKIGIKATAREFDDGYTVIQTVAKNVPISPVPGWGKDYADASTFAVLFDSASILATGNINYSLIGLTPKKAESLKGIKGDFEGIPSVDADIQACNKLGGDERTTCWADFDKKLMETVVPWVPYLDASNVDIIGPAVTQYQYDQFPGEVAYAHVAVDPSKQN
jgi:peptide/nickel transport system substrate-binding protein